MNQLEQNGTWEIVERQRDQKLVGCKQIYTIKHKSDESLDCYKWEDEYCSDLIISCSFTCMGISTFNVKDVFMQGDLEQEEFFGIPPWFSLTNEEKHVWIKEVPSSMVWKIHKGNGVLRLQEKRMRSHCVFQTLTTKKTDCTSCLCSYYCYIR